MCTLYKSKELFKNTICNIGIEGLKYVLHSDSVLERDVSSRPSSLDFKLKQVQVKDTEPSPAELS